jgi:hypothetical protein
MVLHDTLPAQQADKRARLTRVLYLGGYSQEHIPA